MDKRLYGAPPYKTMILHGGPGAIGDVSELCLYISDFQSVLEPFMIEKSIQKQIDLLKKELSSPVTLVGYSWGAMMAILLANTYPELIEKLILISCPPLNSEDAQLIMKTRMQRLTEEERHKFTDLMQQAEEAKSDVIKTNIMLESLKITDKADMVNPMMLDYDSMDFKLDVYEALWPPTSEFRTEGKFIEAVKNIQKPITFIHGAYDPHPISSIQKIIPDLYNAKLHTIENCGHTPWLEKDAKDSFFALLKKCFVKISNSGQA